MPSKPITPDEIVDAKRVQLPDVVFDAFNELIAKYWNGRESTFNMDEAVNLIAEKMDDSLVRATIGNDTFPGVHRKRDAVFANKWLDIEEVYREAGWIVEFDKPDYNKSYPATYSFRKPK